MDYETSAVSWIPYAVDATPIRFHTDGGVRHWGWREDQHRGGGGKTVFFVIACAITGLLLGCR